MPRVAKERRLRRRARRERQWQWLSKFWGLDWDTKRTAYLRTVPIKRGMSRLLRRKVIQARATMPAMELGGHVEMPASQILG